MNKELAQQYNGFLKDFLKDHAKFNADSRKYFYNQVDEQLKNKLVLDMACGDGQDILHYRSLGATVIGIDASSKLVNIANSLGGNVDLGYMENLPYPDRCFDIVLSKWALQSSTDVPKVVQEIHRVLKPKGLVAYLTVHPLRQFLEKKKHPKDYFKQEIVYSKFFEGKVVAREPSHTMTEYISPFFLKNFKILSYDERPDFPNVEQIEGDNYPCFLFIKARKEL